MTTAVISNFPTSTERIDHVTENQIDRMNTTITAVIRRATWINLTSADREDVKSRGEKLPRESRDLLALVMVLRRVSSAAPELVDELVEQFEIAHLLSEFGVSIQMERFIADAGGSTGDIVAAHYAAEASAA